MTENLKFPGTIASPPPHTHTPVSYTHLDVYKRQETYWYIKQYDKGNYMSFVANEGITARRMKYKAKARDVTSGTIHKN